MRKNAQLIPSLDGLRAISIGLVIFAHIMNGDFMGNLGVRIFFVISGYLITYLLLKEFDSSGKINLKRFYFRRTMRIFAPFYFFLLTIGILDSFEIVPLSIRGFLAPFTYTSDYLLSDSWITGHCWSLCVEEQFYLIFPLLLVTLKKKRTSKLLVFILFLAPVLRLMGYHLYPESEAATVYGFHANMDALASGCLLALVSEYEACRKLMQKISALPQTVIIATAILIYAANTQNQHPHFFLGIAATLMNIGIALIIYWGVNNADSCFAGRILNTKILSFIGMISYSLYLWQQVFTVREEVAPFPYNLLLLIICALVSYYTVEKYSLKLRSYLERGGTLKGSKANVNWQLSK